MRRNAHKKKSGAVSPENRNAEKSRTKKLGPVCQNAENAKKCKLKKRSPEPHEFREITKKVQQKNEQRANKEKCEPRAKQEESAICYTATRAKYCDICDTLKRSAVHPQFSKSLKKPAACLEILEALKSSWLLVWGIGQTQ